MLTFSGRLSTILKYNFSEYQYEDLLFFDIETTGFSANSSNLYLIGCTYYENNSWYYIQWFNDDTKSEISIITAFFNFMKNYKLLIHFNGDGFDIPYIQKKCKHFNLDYNFNNIKSFDIYKCIKPYKKLLSLENCKQKTIERFLHINRKDIFNGGELINVYHNFLECNFSPIVTPDKRATLQKFLGLLLCHNKDDITGLLDICQILQYYDFFNNYIFKIKNCNVANNFLNITAITNDSLPTDFQISCFTCNIFVSQNSVVLNIPIFHTELKFFFENYKDYYYLPKEDSVVHKDIAQYVDKEFKQKAKASNCYVRKNSIFIPQLSAFHSPFFKKDYKDKQTFVELTATLLDDNDFLEDFVLQTIRTL